MVVEVGRKKKSGPDQRERESAKKKVQAKVWDAPPPVRDKVDSNRSRDRGCEFALVPEHRLVVEAEMNGMPLGPFIRRIKSW